MGNYLGTDITGRKSLGDGFDGVLIDAGASGNTIGGTSAGAANIISANVGSGVDVQGSGTTGNQVLGNYIGTDVTGSVALANKTDGVSLSAGAGGNTIGGTVTGAANLISGDANYGVSIQGNGTTTNVVVGNLIGTDSTGSHPIGNAFGGIAIYNGAVGNTIGGTGNSARNVISGNASNGVAIANAGTTGNLVLGNFIGSDITGSSALGNSADGVLIDGGATGNTVGGTATTAAGNLISGNTGDGVDIQGSGTTGNLVLGNYLGTDVTGSMSVGNGANGVNLSATAVGNTIGGTVTGAENLISGNTDYGVNIQDNGTTANVVEGNFIGTVANGSGPKGNLSGVVISNASGNTIGGSTSAVNVISGNSYAGVVLTNSASGNLVAGNYVGSDVFGLKAVGNSSFGVLVYNGASGNTISDNLISGNGGSGVEITGNGTNANVLLGNFIGTNVSGANPLANQYYGVGVDSTASDNTIGGTTVGAANVIAFNAAAGAWVGSGTGNSVRRNSIFSNAGLGIDVAPAGPNPNQPSGSGTGANNLQDYPVFSSFSFNGSTATVQGSFPGTPNTTYTLDFYANPPAGFSAYYQGKTYLGSIPATANASGVADFSASFTNVPSGQTYITATATDSTGDTSEFCLPFASAADVANYITTTQLSNGAVRESLNPGAYDLSGNPVYEVDPYFADLAVRGLLSAPAVGSSNPLTVAENYFLWYLGNLNTDGTINNFWYYANGALYQNPGPPATPTPTTPDSNDSYAATFLSDVWQYYQAGGSPSFFQMPGVQSELGLVGNVLLSCQLSNGLTETFLPGNGPEDSYTEDNSEAYAGFLAMSQIESQVYGNAAAAQNYAAAAGRCQSGIMTNLYNSSTGLFNVDPNTLANTTQWYPGTISLAWPILFGVVSPTGAIAEKQMATIDAAWNGPAQQNWTTRTDSASIGFAALLRGDNQRAQDDISTLARDPFPTPLVSPAGAVTTVADAGWLLRTLLTPTTAVTSSADPSLFGQAVTFTATVTINSPGSNAVANPTGVATFYDGGVSIGQGTLSGMAPDIATFTTSTLSAGTHAITAAYTSGNFAAGPTSAVIIQTVSQASTITSVVSSADPSVSGQPVTFTATVSVNSAGSNTPANPTGNVTFYDHGVAIGKGTLTGTRPDTATFTTSTLSVGTHPITANYVGGTNFAGSASIGAITTLASFNNTNGAYPYAGLVEDGSGDLFGATSEGGASNDGTVFEVAPAAAPSPPSLPSTAPTARSPRAPWLRTAAAISSVPPSMAAPPMTGPCSRCAPAVAPSPPSLPSTAPMGKTPTRAW